ncbi:hypothetical protein F5888DRAFT_1644982 [Russula emetica]|nr:hypothetical protein F5888DRAFT_1644982 [Russula emetica]
MNATVRERLIRAEQKFLLAIVSDDEESHDTFSQEWSQLAHDIENIKAAGRLDDHTALLLFKVSRAIESTTLCMLECMAISQESLTHSIGNFIQDIPFDDPSIASLHSQAIAPRHLLFSDNPSSKIPNILGQQTLLDSYAYCWLMRNIHDPYPSSVQIRIISDASGASVAQVEHWFQEVRDSIGWSKLSHKFFAGSVTATVAAARRVFLERDKNVSFEIVFAFTAAKAYAEKLFLDLPPLQGKDVVPGSVQTIQTTAVDQDHCTWPYLDKSIIDPESIPVPPQVNLLAPQEPLSDLSDSDESEEDTTPPPSIAGRKRPLSEDVLISQVADLVRPQKRHRTRSIYRTHSSEPECPHPLPSTLGLSSEQIISCILATPVSSFPSSHQLSLTSPASSPDPSRPISQKRGCVEDTLEFAQGPIHARVPVHGIHKRRLSQCVLPPPSKRQRRPSISSEGNSVANPTPPFDGYRDLSLPQGRPPDPDQFPQPTLQVPLDSDIPVDLGVFDWNSISDPLVGWAPSISQPAVVYVPSSDLSSQLLEPPDLGHGATFTSSSSNDLGSLQDLSSLLQFPMPPGPDLSTFAALPHSDDSSFSLENFDWSTITESNNLFPPDSTQWPSPSTSSSGPPTPPDNSFESLPSSQSSYASEQPLSQLDPSVPPSVFLPFGSGAFTENLDNTCSLLLGEYGDPVAHTFFRAAC